MELKRTLKYLYVLLACSGLGLLAFFVRFSLVENKIFNSTHNHRPWSAPRAQIVDRNGVVLATGYGEDRRHSLGAAACHVVGYVHPRIGTGGELEMKHSNLLISNSRSKFSYFNSTDAIKNSSLATTLDSKLQVIADQALGSNKGAIVIMNAETGEVLAMVSHPNFHPDRIRQNWKELNVRKDSPLFNRAKGSYPPGSVWKTIIASLLVEKGDKPFECTGTYSVGGKVFKCPHRHGTLSGLKQAYAVSCNTYFVSRGVNEIKPADFLKASGALTAQKMPAKMGAREYGLAILGQGPVSISPMEGCLLAAAVANKGQLPQPCLIKGEKKGDYEVMGREKAESLKECMVEAVKSGTGRQLSPFLDKGLVGIKTGTAEKASGRRTKNVAWMVGFASNGKHHDVLAFAVVIEDSPSYAAEICSPVVSRILERYFSANGRS